MENIVLLLGIIVVTIAIFKYCKMPSIIAYLLIGLLLGPYALGVFSNNEIIETLAEIGVVFLLFTIGLELPLSRFIAMRYNLFLLGGGQVLLSTVFFIFLLSYFFNIGLITSLVIASALSLSSTAIIIRQLSEQNELFSKHGHLAFAMLIFQDLAVVPLLILLPILAQFNLSTFDDINNFSSLSVLTPIFIILLKGTLVFVLILFMAKFVLKKFFYYIAITKSLELFMFSVLFIALLSASITHAFGLSMSFGAFVAGIGLGESEYRHHINAEIRPFRDVLLGIFFISVGSFLDLNIVINNLFYITIGVVALITTKAILITMLCTIFARKSDLLTDIKTGLIMSHAGEFGLAIFTLAASYSLISADLAQIILAIMIISLFIAVLLTKYSDNISINILQILKFCCFNKKLKNNISLIIDEYTMPKSKYHNKLNNFDNVNNSVKSDNINTMHGHYPHLSNHIIICGFGRVGRVLVKFLKEQGKEYVALEHSPDTVKYGVIDNYKVYYGDATRQDVLDYIGLSKAKMIVICIDNDDDTSHIVRNIRLLNKSIPILVRVKDLSNYKHLIDLGASEIIAETVETSHMLILNMFTMLGIDADEALDLIKQSRNDRGHIYNDLKIISNHKIIE